MTNMRTEGLSFYFKSRATRFYTPLCQSVGRSVGRSSFYFFGVFKPFGLTAPSQMRL